MNKQKINKAMLNVARLNVANLNYVGERTKGSSPVVDDGYFHFADPEVERIVVANWGDGVGITQEQVEAVTNIGTVFKGNTTIERFDEFERFKGVTHLGESLNQSSSGAFYGCSSLKSVMIPSSVKDIRPGVFNGCSNLENIGSDLSHITTIGYTAFYGTTNFNGVINFKSLNQDSIPQQCFYNSGITRIESLGKATIIGGSNQLTGGAFYGCKDLQYIPLENVTSISYGAFYGCISLEIEDLSLPNLETLGQNAFYGVSIKKISNLGKITTLPSASASTQLFGKKDVLEEIVLPETVTDIPVYSFVDYTALSKYNLSHVKTINGYAFRNTPYKDVVDLSSIVSLGDNAIKETNWGKIIIGENCTTINKYNFWNLKSTPILIVRSVTPPSLAANNNMNFCSVIYVPDASVTAYKEASGWVDYADRIKPLSEYVE